MKKAYGSNVSYINALLIDCKGIRTNWLGSIRMPMTADNNGSLYLRLKIGTFVGSIIPYWIELWGIVGEIIG